MAYIINDKALIEEICKLRKIIQEEKSKLSTEGYQDFVYPLDEEIIGSNGKLNNLSRDDNGLFLYSAAQSFSQACRALPRSGLRDPNGASSFPRDE